MSTTGEQNGVETPVTPPTNNTPLPEVTKPKHAGGRPPIWTSPEVLKKLVDNYFENEKRVTLSGLACALDISRRTLYDYAERDEFLYIIKKARERVEKVYEDILMYEDKPTGVIFALKNMGWADVQKTDLTSGGEKLPTPILGGATNVQTNDGH